MFNILGGIADIGNAVGGIFQNIQNQKNWEKSFDQNQQNLKDTWMREDTAVQRRAEDLKAAGLNPLLAAGGAASAGAPIQSSMQQSAPRADMSNTVSAMQQMLNSKALKLQSMQMSSDIARTEAQKTLIDEQARGVRLENDDFARRAGLNQSLGTSTLASGASGRAVDKQTIAKLKQDVIESNQRIKESDKRIISSYIDDHLKEIESIIADMKVDEQGYKVKSAKYDSFVKAFEANFRNQYGREPPKDLISQIMSGIFLDARGSFSNYSDSVNEYVRGVRRLHDKPTSPRMEAF